MIERIGVCGAGTMGRGIAQICAQAGYYTCLFDVNESMLLKSQSAIEKDLDSLCEKGRITEAAKEKALFSLRYVSDVKDCIGDIIIEAIVEDKETKIRLFQQLARLNSINTIFATNTSSISVSSIAEKIS